ncbi:hypothetical protein OG599_24390 [Streptomyces sp. NBC_01335]|uniref:cupin domain-containing protein n=1 Tax=Streptomyces sp. NBC_01335 TaxID=2903828 RepID=UPI002E0E2E0B|nr:hypothetical protein OG599_24390 [Streptomyces sp. NBC_01335]
MIISPAAAHAEALQSGAGAVLRRCLARRGMLHSECEAVDQIVLEPHARIDHRGRAGVDEAWFVLSGTVTVDECDSAPWSLHAGQLMLSPAGARPHLSTGDLPVTLLLLATLPDRYAAQLPPRIPELHHD